MGLNDNDKIRGSISLIDAYSKIKQWYRNNINLAKELNSDYGNRSVELIENLPDLNKINELEIRAILGEVIYGYLEWAYHKSDNTYKMSAYAHGALESNNLYFQLSENEQEELKNSSLWKLLIISVNQ